MNPPLYEDALLNQQDYNTATYTDGRNNHEKSNLLPQQSSNNGSVPAPLNRVLASRNSSNLLPQQSSNNDAALALRKPKLSLSNTILLGLLMITAISMIISMIIVTFHFHPKRDQDKMGSEWEAKERAHQVIRDTWNLERQAMVIARESWHKERTDIILEREAMAMEREKWKRELIDHENRQRQEEEEKRALIVWQDLKASTQCLRHGTREYLATLAQVPLGMDPLKECWKKSIDIHGRQLFPSQCDTQVCFNLHLSHH